MRKLDIAGVGKKLTGMANRIVFLTRYKNMTLDEYVQDLERQAVVERYLEVTIQAAIDINRMLIKSLQESDAQPFTSSESFTLVTELGIISSEIAAALIPSVTFRNVLAHDYDDVMLDAAYRGLQLALTQYPEYIRQVKTYINSIEEDYE
jgi:uncharacterized protein YutE (UPF0331/DUF86 family)